MLHQILGYNTVAFYLQVGSIKIGAEEYTFYPHKKGSFVSSIV